MIYYITGWFYGSIFLDLCNKEKALTFKRVSVPEIDTLFADIADAFHKQQDDYIATRTAIQRLKETYNCLPANSLSTCIEKIKQEHGNVMERRAKTKLKFPLLMW